MDNQVVGRSPVIYDHLWWTGCGTEAVTHRTKRSPSLLQYTRQLIHELIGKPTGRSLPPFGNETLQPMTRQVLSGLCPRAACTQGPAALAGKQQLHPRRPLSSPPAHLSLPEDSDSSNQGLTRTPVLPQEVVFLLLAWNPPPPNWTHHGEMESQMPCEAPG